MQLTFRFFLQIFNRLSTKMFLFITILMQKVISYVLKRAFHETPLQ